MVQLVEEVKHTNENVCALDEKVDRMDSRVDSIEKRTGRGFEKKYKNTVVTAIISTVAGALASGLIFFNCTKFMIWRI